jgi:hypothetical protein
MFEMKMSKRMKAKTKMIPKSQRTSLSDDHNRAESEKMHVKSSVSSEDS